MKMTYVCIYNAAEKIIDGAEQYEHTEEAQARHNMYVVECLARGAPWAPYIGPEPFGFNEAE
jgi:hypothetical protein